MVNKEDKRLLRKLRGLQNEFGYTVTKDTNKVAYSLIYGLALKGGQVVENFD